MKRFTLATIVALLTCSAAHAQVSQSEDYFESPYSISCGSALDLLHGAKFTNGNVSNREGLEFYLLASWATGYVQTAIPESNLSTLSERKAYQSSLNSMAAAIGFVCTQDRQKLFLDAVKDIKQGVIKRVDAAKP